LAKLEAEMEWHLSSGYGVSSSFDVHVSGTRKLYWLRLLRHDAKI